MNTAIIGNIVRDTTIYSDEFIVEGEKHSFDNASFITGGPASTAASVLARFHNTVDFYGQIGNDPEGEFVYNEMSREGINMNHVNKSNNMMTPQGFVIVTNDKRDTSINLKNKTTYDMCVGVTIALSHMSFVAFSHFGQKMLCEEKMPSEVQNYYMGLINTLPAFIVMLMEGKIGISNLWYVLYATSNGVIFYLASYYMAEALSIMPINKFIPMNYLRVVFIFIFGFIILGEHVFFTDIIGSSLIIGFQVYNVCYPVKKIKNGKENNDNNNIKENFIKEIEK